MTQKKAMADANSSCCEMKIENGLHLMQIDVDAEQEIEKMHGMEVLINSMQGGISEEEEEQQDELTQAELDELAGSPLSVSKESS
jgi:hypothetical protein